MLGIKSTSSKGTKHDILHNPKARGGIEWKDLFSDE